MNTLKTCDISLLPNATAPPPASFNLVAAASSGGNNRVCQGQTVSYKCPNPADELIKEFYPVKTSTDFNCGVGGEWETPNPWPTCVTNYTCKFVFLLNYKKNEV